MVRKLRWLFALTPCVPGLTLLLAGFAEIAVPPTLDPTPETIVRDRLYELRAQQLFNAGSVVLVAGMLMGLFILWRIAHPRPEPVEESNEQPPAE